jgi:hypothetical protein
MSRRWHNTILFDFLIQKIKELSFFPGVFLITKQENTLKNDCQNQFSKNVISVFSRNVRARRAQIPRKNNKSENNLESIELFNILKFKS